MSSYVVVVVVSVLKVVKIYYLLINGLMIILNPWLMFGVIL